MQGKIDMDQNNFNEYSTNIKFKEVKFSNKISN